ncbi:hypothetical protein [Glutamicibacter halophytocola]|uniref:hypothetical protein n=1 Tax=Glutamicibacter halophytocola TaxID=1933880 RepID=UPI0015C54EB5|nr:hypothetical protein [Glutamicibacter halophytocola]NQD39950.1 hypothetical protein [Glutamicibacter halophytocola]
MFTRILASTGDWFDPEMDSETFNLGLGDMIGNFFAALYSLVSPIFETIGLLCVLVIIIRLIFGRKRR